MDIQQSKEQPDDKKMLISDVIQSLQPQSESFSATFSDLYSPQQSFLLPALFFAISQKHLIGAADQSTTFAFCHSYHPSCFFIL